MMTQAENFHFAPCFIALFNRDGDRLPKTEQLETAFIKNGTDTAGAFQYRRIDADSVPVIVGVSHRKLPKLGWDCHEFIFADGEKKIVSKVAVDQFLAGNPNVEMIFD